MKEIVFGEMTSRALTRGVDQLVDAVKVTYGPRGRSVVFNKGGLWPTVSNDASSILQYIELTDVFERDAAEFVAEAALKTANTTGGGTTTTAILLQAILKEGIKNKQAGANPMLMRKGIEAAAAAVNEEIMKSSLLIGGDNEMKLVGIVAAGDEEIGTLVAEGMMKTSEYGIVTIEESNVAESFVDYVEGIQFNKGYLSPYMVNRPDTGEALIENPYILATDYTISDFDDILPLIEQVRKAGGNLVIIAKDVTEGALAAIVHNVRRGIIKALCVMCPGTAERSLEYLDDIAVMTGGEVISASFGLKVRDAKLSQLGRAAKVTSTKTRTIISSGKGDPDRIAQRVKDIRTAFEMSTSKFDHDRHQDRLAKMTGGISIIKVGGQTESEMKERKQKAEDALNSISAAMRSGVVPGGGVAFIDAAAAAREIFEEETVADIKTGMKCVLEALGAPARQLAENVGEEGPAVLNRIITENEKGYGFNVETGEYGIMLDMGIADPTQAACTALRTAAHTAALMLTSEAFVADVEDGKEVIV